MKKKLLSLTMAVAMILSLAIPAFAAADNYWTAQSGTTDQATQDIIFQAKTHVPTIKLTLPNIVSDPMILNPYKIDYTGTGATINGTVTVNSANYADQVICPIYAIKNETNAKMVVKAATSTTATGVTMVSDHVDITDSAKKAFLQFVVQKASASAVPAISNGAAYASLDPYDTAANTVITLNSSTTNATVVANLPSAVSGSTTTANYLLYQFSGELSRQPSTAWTTADTVSTTVTFTFSPVSGTDTSATWTGWNLATAAILAADQSTAKTFDLPKIQSNALATFTTGFASSDLTAAAQLHATDPKWDVVDEGALTGLETTGSGSTGYKLSVPATALNILPKDGADHNYDVVLSYLDKNSVPRTMKVTLTIARNS